MAWATSKDSEQTGRLQSDQSFCFLPEELFPQLRHTKKYDLTR